MNPIDKLILRPFSFDGGEFEMPSPDIAEAHAKAHDESAAYLKKKGRRDLANKQRKLAAWWRGLAGLSDADARRLCDDLLLKGTETIDALLALQGKASTRYLILACS